MKKRLGRKTNQIIQYTKQGDFVRIWGCAEEAAKALGCTPTLIRKVVTSDKSKTAKGYQFIKPERVSPYRFMIPTQISPLTRKIYAPIKQMDRYGNVVMVWDTIVDAAEWLGISPAAISRCVNGYTYMCGGFKWKRIQDEK